MQQRADSSSCDGAAVDAGRTAGGGATGKAAGWVSRTSIAAAAGMLLLLPTSHGAIAQPSSLPTVSSAEELCAPSNVIFEAGRVVDEGAVFQSQIYGLIIEYRLRSGMHLAMGLFSLNPRHIDQLGARSEFDRALQSLEIPPNSVVGVRSCRPFYSRSEMDHTSYLHANLIREVIDPVTNRTFVVPRFHATSAYLIVQPPIGGLPPVAGLPFEHRPNPTVRRGPENKDPTKDPKSAHTHAPPARGEAVGPGTVRRKPEDKPKVATLAPPPDPRWPTEPEKPLKQYAKPQYRLLSGSPAFEMKDRARGTGRAMFAVEKVECSDQGNWMTGYFGIVRQIENHRKLVIKQRYGVNNYPGEGIIGLAELKSQKKPEFTCNIGDSTCSAPRETLSYEKFLKSDQRRTDPPLSASSAVISISPIDLTKQPEVADKSGQWSCRPDRNLCVSRATDHWQCDPQSGACASYEPTRWWCVPRREFCFSRVRFRDWGSRYDENDEIMLKDSDLVYDMADGFLPIVKDALTQRCGGSEPAGNWSETWSKWADKGPNPSSSK